MRILKNAEIAQLVEHNLAKVGVASSSLVFRSKGQLNAVLFCYILFVLLSIGKAGWIKNRIDYLVLQPSEQITIITEIMSKLREEYQKI